jgi:hypothetical protein
MTPDRITVFIPIKHYHARFLREAVASVLQQTSAAWTLLLLVHEERFPEFQSLLAEPLADPRVRLVARQGRLLGGAYNTAMRAADTTFITVLLGDDMLAETAVATLAEHIGANPTADVFYSGRCFIDADGSRLSSDYPPIIPVTRERFLRGSPIKHLFCWRVRAGLACGGVDETLNNFGSDDYDFPWTLLDHGAVFHPIPDALYRFRDHREGVRLTTHVPRSVQRRELARILAKHGVPKGDIRRLVRYATGSTPDAAGGNPTDDGQRAPPTDPGRSTPFPLTCAASSA